jgi:ATP-binding cassette subfamily F protein uup
VAYEGTVLLVSHDRAFLNNVVSSTLVFEGDQLREYVGGYDDWVRQRGAAVEARSPTPRFEVASSQPAKPTPSPAAPAEKTKKLSYKDQRELERLPALIEELEQRQVALHAEFAEAEFFKQPGERLAAKQAELQDVTAKLAAAFARWELLEG